jgi:hypothetical protein
MITGLQERGSVSASRDWPRQVGFALLQPDLLHPLFGVVIGLVLAPLRQSSASLEVR